jgi:hypothetical protein
MANTNEQEQLLNILDVLGLSLAAFALLLPLLLDEAHKIAVGLEECC